MPKWIWLVVVLPMLAVHLYGKATKLWTNFSCCLVGFNPAGVTIFFFNVYNILLKLWGYLLYIASYCLTHLHSRNWANYALKTSFEQCSKIQLIQYAQNWLLLEYILTSDFYLIEVTALLEYLDLICESSAKKQLHFKVICVYCVHFIVVFLASALHI